MSDSEEESDLSLGAVFPEPERPPTPEPTMAIYNRQKTSAGSDTWDHISIRLVGAHPLWGHYLWNAARSFAYFLDMNPSLYEQRCVLELGAGGGLPGIVAAKNGAKKVVLTDYPDQSLIENLEYNVDQNISGSTKDRSRVMGYIWGHSVKPLIDESHSNGFDLIILSDLVFNHSQHDALLKTCEEALPNDAATVLVFYTHHRPHLAHRDLEFFTKAAERGWNCEEVVQEKFPPMFPDDPGAEDVRSTVHGWKLTRKGGSS